VFFDKKNEKTPCKTVLKVTWSDLATTWSDLATTWSEMEFTGLSAISLFF
jgi:hypothetical protein